ncbi:MULTISPECIES: tetratricopeptide repeat protein [unclassified Dyella]|uniref:tetratricopeptide repeat protein n=1 Tax=unclassified Dyella TaxID=2634549 RepID=UPI003F9238BE
MSFLKRYGSRERLLFVLALMLTMIIYWPGLSGGWLFDDYPNILSNHAVQPTKLDFRALVRAALSSPASEFKRPLASLTFVVNFAISGLNPWGWKLTNLAIHLLNGILMLVLSRLLLLRVAALSESITKERANVVAALIAGAWMILPINLSAVLYIVQREESLANLFVLLGLIGYTAGRISMLAPTTPDTHPSRSWRGILVCALSIVVPTTVGVLAKETAVLLPLYALCAEWILFGFSAPSRDRADDRQTKRPFDWRIGTLFGLTLLLPAVIGIAWLLPAVLDPTSWATRDFTLTTRLLTEGRVVLSYLIWTVLPTPQALSFYHDQYQVSSSLLAPWTTLASILALLVLAAFAVRVRRRFPLVALGIMWFISGHLLTGTILPLELVYEHRNYFAGFGIMLVIVPLLTAPGSWRSTGKSSPRGALPLAMPRHILFGGLVVCWSALTLVTSYAWGDSLRQASDFASRAPNSPRAMYELGRTYIIYSNYEPTSPYRSLAYDALEKAAALPESSILPQQALIFMNSRMHVPLEDRWWDSMIAKLKARKSTVQDESSLEELSSCQTNGECDLPKQRMLEAYLAALSHPNPSARLLNMYGMYAWEVLADHNLAVQMLQDAVNANPKEPAYRITLVRMLTDAGRLDEARQALRGLQTFNLAGHMDEGIATLNARIAAKQKDDAPHAQSN